MHATPTKHMHPLEATLINTRQSVRSWLNGAKARTHADDLVITSILEGVSYAYMSGSQLWLTIALHNLVKNIDAATHEVLSHPAYWSVSLLLLSMQLEAMTLEKKGYSASLAPTLSYIGSGKAKTAAALGQVANFGKSFFPYGAYSIAAAFSGNGERSNWLEAAIAIGYIQGSWYLFWNALIYTDKDAGIKEAEARMIKRLARPD